MQYTSREVYEYISKHNNDPIVEWKICTVSGQPFAIFQSDVDFYEKISPVFLGKKFMIPTPTLCPEERQRRRLMFRNERKLYKRKCDATGETIISMHSPDKSYKVYEQSYRRSDKRDPLSYGQDFDYTKTFKDQFTQLLYNVPALSLYNEYNSLDNCTYINCSWRSKDSYMAIDSGEITNCLRSNKVYHSHYLLDCFNLDYCEHVYECISCLHCNNIFYSSESSECSDCLWITNCINCHHCIFSSDLRNTSYCILNNRVDEAEYTKVLDRLFSDSNYRDELYKKYCMIKSQIPKRSMTIFSSEECIGHNIWDSYRSRFCFDVKQCKDSRYIYGNDFDFTDCGDICIGTSVIRGYESMSIEGNLIGFCIGAGGTGTHDMRYDYYCRNCSNCFGCVGLKNKQYCIFNKQYTKEKYDLTVAKIVAHMIETGEWGEFFHPSLSPFGYNETVANEHFPLSKQEAIVRGYKWQDKTYDPIIPEGAKVIDRKTTTEEIKDDEQILKAIFVCEISGRPYRIIKQELEFYRKHHLPLPRRHPDVRHEERTKLRPGRTLYLRNCDKCTKEMLSVYTPKEVLLEGDAKYEGKVYCESCYQKEVYA